MYENHTNTTELIPNPDNSVTPNEADAELFVKALAEYLVS
jgi:hypothetical protein